MEITNSQTAIATEEVIEFDTSLVLFFLSMDVGYKLLAFSFEAVVMMVALLAVLVAPFILERGDSGFGRWLAGRSLIAGLGLVPGVVLANLAGTLLPESFGAIPFMLLIMAAMLSVFVSFASLLGFSRR
jgi:hypothetical protein